MADEDGKESVDPYASAKSNLRDTVKWLATTFAALASAVLAGASITGISGLQGGMLAAALLTAGLGLLCIFGAIGILLRLLTAESFFLAQLDAPEFASTKAQIVKHADDILSPVFKNLDDFMAKRKLAVEEIRKEPGTDLEEQARQEALDFFGRIADETSRLVSLALLEVMRQNLKRREGVLFALAVGAIVGIGAFAVLTGASKSSAQAVASAGTLELFPGTEWQRWGHALSQSCGGVATLKAELIARPQPGWVEVRLLSPEACAGMRLDVPAQLTLAPQH